MSETIEFEVGEVSALAFTANGEYLLSGGDEGVQVWRVKDGERVATMKVEGGAWCVAVSKDGKYIAAGSCDGAVLIWDATNYKRVRFAGKIDLIQSPIFDVDFSPDSSRLVSADGTNNTATVWDIAARQMTSLDHGAWVLAAKYSPQGDRIATISYSSVQVWDSDSGRLLVDVKAELRPLRGLLWFNNHLFVKTNDSKIKQIDASTGSTFSEWSVPSTNASITLPQHGQFVAYSGRDSITFWDTTTHTQLGFISQSNKNRSIAFSPGGHILAVVQEQKIIIKDLSVTKDLDLRIENAALDAWNDGQLTNAEALLTAAISTTKDTAHVLANRALIRARLRQWDAALIDAEESIKIWSSVVGYIAKFVALIGKGDIHAGRRVCDIAFQLYPNHVSLLLLIKAVVLFVAGEHDDAISRIDDLVHAAYFDPTFYVVQAYVHFLRGNLHMGNGDYKSAIQSFEDARVKLGNCTHPPPLIVSLILGWKFDNFATTIRQQLCEALFVAGRTVEASESVLYMIDRKNNATRSIKIWISEFIQRCLSTPENDKNASSVTTNVSYPMMALLREWTRSRLTIGSWEDALASATGFILPRLTIYQVICEGLETTGRVADAVTCFHQMCRERGQAIDGKQAAWTREFKHRCSGKLENLGDIAMNANEYDEAILSYTTALLLNPATLRDLLGKRSKAHASKGDWEDALNDANYVIMLDPSSPLGYQRRHAALHGMGCHDDATGAFKAMLLKISESPDPEIREQSHHYVRPEKTKEAIRTIIGDTIRDLPPILIDTVSGRLCNKSEQASTFETTPAFTELISSMTTHIDHSRIEQDVGEYFRYVTFSHKWEENEPLFEMVTKIVVYDLETSPTHEKLKMFCKVVREAGFNWAWSDTCCVNQGDHIVLQEALVCMFKWYERSAMTIIFLRGVDRRAKHGALTRSIWNMRAWTLQEYHASKVVRIYTEDWTPYLSLEIFNHKDSPEIISEMEEATGISAQALMALRPGLDDIREKLRLASTRQTTRVEDAAYSLFGIFSLSLPILYGEGDKALSKLLAQLLTSSGDTSILAWTGRSGSFNSCLPASITVFSQPPTSHIPSAIADTEMRTITASLRASSLDLLPVTTLYDQLHGLPVPFFAGQRMKVPCLIFKIKLISASWNGPEHTFLAQTGALGVVEIKTRQNLLRLDSLYLIHPWIDFLLDRHPVRHVVEMTRDGDIASSGQGELPSFPDISSNSTMDKQIRVLQFVARLRRPFGALLLTPTRRNVDEYRRISTESLITVQVKELAPAILDKLVQSVRMLDVL